MKTVSENFCKKADSSRFSFIMLQFFILYRFTQFFWSDNNLSKNAQNLLMIHFIIKSQKHQAALIARMNKDESKSISITR